MKIIEVGPIFGENVRILRTRYSLSQKALAKLVGISLPVLRMLERGEITHRITDETLQRLCAVLNVPAERLISPSTES